MRVVARIAGLLVLWLLAWGEVTVANVASGIVVAGALLLALPSAELDDHHPRPRPLGMLRLVGYVLTQLVTSNLLMARNVVRRHPASRPGVLAHRLQHPSDEIVTIMTSVLALSPGTMTVDVDEASTTVYVHFLLLDDVPAARASLERLEALARSTLKEPS